MIVRYDNTTKKSKVEKARVTESRSPGPTTGVTCVITDPVLILVGVVVTAAPLVLAGINPTWTWAVVMALIVASLLVHKSQQLASRQLSMRFGMFESLTVAFLVISAVSVIASVNFHASATEFLHYLVYVMLAWAVRKSAPDLRSLRFLVLAVVLGSSMVAWLGIKQYVEQLHAGGGANWRIFSTFYNPNLLAGYLELALPLCFVGAVVSSERASKMVLGFAFALNLVAFLLTGSKGGLLALGGATVAMLAAWALTSPHAVRVPVKRLVPVALVIALLIFLAGRPLLPRLLAAFGSESNSSQFRWLLWKSTWQIFRDHPWCGTGIGTFASIYPKYAIAGFTRMAHENYLQMASEGGIGLAVVFLALLATGIVAATRVISSDDRESSLWGCGLLGSLVAFSIHGLVDYTWYVPGIAIALVASSSLAVSLHDQCRTPQAVLMTVPLPGGRGTWIAATVLVMVLLTLPLYAQCRLSYAAMLCDQIRSLPDEAASGEALATCRRAVRLAPRCGEYYSQLAYMRSQTAIAKGDDDQANLAVREFQSAIACQPTVPTNYLRLARLRSWQNNLREAEACLRKALQWNPNDTGALVLWAAVLEKEEKPDEARKKYQRVVEISNGPVERFKAIPDLFDENYILAQLGLGKLDLQARNLSEARAEFDQAIQWAERTLKSGNSIFNSPDLDLSVPRVSAPKSYIQRLKAESLVWEAKSWWDDKNKAQANRLINEALDIDPAVAGLVNEIIGK